MHNHRDENLNAICLSLGSYNFIVWYSLWEFLIFANMLSFPVPSAICVLLLCVTPNFHNNGYWIEVPNYDYHDYSEKGYLMLQQFREDAGLYLDINK